MEHGNKTVGDLIAFLQTLPKDRLIGYFHRNCSGDEDTGICQSFEVEEVKEREYIVGDKPYTGHYEPVDCLRLFLHY